MSLLFAAIADDDTGATDIAGMLAQQGVRTLLVLEGASDEELRAWASHADAVVIGTASRNIPPQEAYDRTAAAIARIAPFTPKTFFIKYCSTFDSTAVGNIGPSIDAAMDALQQRFTIALPALPVNGRTTYMGHHFVGAQLLSESSMRHHPLTPMTESNLVAHLQKQTKRNVSLIDLHTVRRGHDAIRERMAALGSGGGAIAIADCTCEEDLAAVGEAVAGERLLSGSSALASVLPASWRAQGVLQESRNLSLHRKRRSNAGFLAAAGSCSAATQQQNAHAAAHGWVIVELDTVALASGTDLSEIVLSICNEIGREENVLVKTTSGASDIDRFRSWCDTHGISQAEGGERISRGLAAMVREVVHRSDPQGVLIAGGETSGAACRALNIRALNVGEQIAPGVPVCMPLSGVDVPIALKSGNFGGEDFYERAMQMMRDLPIVRRTMKTVYAIHTGPVLVDVFKKLFPEHLPGVRLVNVVDDGLLADVRAAGHLIPSVTRRLIGYGVLAQSSGADAIFNCCSSVGEAADMLAQTVDIPVVKIDDRMASEAVRLGSRIGILATVVTTLDPTERLVQRKATEAGKKIETRRYLNDGAFDALVNGDAAKHDAMVAAEIERAMAENDVVVLAQGSMARIVPMIKNPNGIPVLSSPMLGIEALKERLGL